ncbi:MAG: hypothetical protein SGILL_009884 [Bacillariaceae sp.]
MGPGKARTILQPSGLLRPESVLCLFSQGFHTAALEHNASDTLTKVVGHPRVGSNLIQSKEEQVLTYRDSPVSDDDKISLGRPVVATDDIFLRQRIVEQGGLVMTFHQLWVLLTEIQAEIDQDVMVKPG